MRRFISFILAFAVLFTTASFAEERPERGNVVIINDPIEEGKSDDDELNMLEGDEDDAVVENPDEEIMLDDVMIASAFDKLDSMRNILLLGMDSRDNTFVGRTDTMILLTVDIDGKIIKMTSFLRDLYVEIPGKKNNRLNAAYVFGGYDLLAKTFEKNFGIKPDAYVAVNLRGLANMIDKLGGVYVTVKDSKVDRVNAVIYWYNKQVLELNNLKDGYLTKGGYQLLNGKQAEAWARYRYSETDHMRSERQRELLTIIFDKLKNMNIMELISFVKDNASMVKTNLSINELLSLAPAVIAMGDAEIRQLRLPVDGAYKAETVSGMSVLVPDRKKNAKALADFLNAK